jgi:predicted DNA-binding transcriptional regulator AlpA
LALTAKANSALPREPGRHDRDCQILCLEPRGLSPIQSAAYIGVSPALLDELVGDGRMPQPKKINSRVVWDRKQLDEALPDREDRNPWDEEDAA